MERRWGCDLTVLQGRVRAPPTVAGAVPSAVVAALVEQRLSLVPRVYTSRSK